MIRGGGVIRTLQSFQDNVDADLVRTQKTRTKGNATVLVSDAIGEGSKCIEPCQDLVDEIRLLDTLLHHYPRIKGMASSSPTAGVTSTESSHYPLQIPCKYVIGFR
jgi:hypothetical protein